ncbi:MAG TPA: imidazolonepropionase [Polyangiaceae bacterium]|nr:imidazolonepropionase [Polyangiaceae bacterium]
MTAQGFAAQRIVTCDPERVDPLGVIEPGAVVFEAGRIVYVGPRDQAPASATLLDMGDRVVTPGLVDAHTHACWIGSRHLEYAMRLGGADYRDIARAGGGIKATHKVVVQANEEALAEELAARLKRMASLGATTVEVKSGYGLDAAHELKQLEAIAQMATRTDLPSVVPTFLALHALPDGADRARYVDSVASDLVPEVARARLARFVDAYVDVHAFAVDEARRVFDSAIAHGLGVRLHAGQFADVGAARLAASLGAASVDHLEHVDEKALDALAGAQVSVVLLPIASFTLGHRPPPVAQMRKAGIDLVVASDANPGTAPSESLPLALAFSVRAYGLTPEEALLGATRHAAASLRLEDRGMLRAGKRADIVVWDLPHEFAIVQPWGVAKTRQVVIGGRPR